MATPTSAAPAALESTDVYARVGRRLLPFLWVCYIFAFLDRNNTGFAKLDFMHDLGLTEAAYGFAAGIFYLGYITFEIPSNLLLARVGARRTMTRILLLWGTASTATAFVPGATALYVMRFLLGAAEAGFFPGVLLYLTYWAPRAQRARFTSWFMMAIPASGMLGSPLSGWIMHATADWEYLHAWQWLFLLEGLPVCLLSVFAFFFLSDGPAEARWLTEADKARIAGDLAREEVVKSATGLRSFRAALRDRRFYLLTFMAFALFSASTGFFFWLPSILRNLGIRDVLNIGLVGAIPFSAAAVAQLAIARHSDRVLERRWHTACAALAGAVGWILLTFGDGHPVYSVAMLTLAAAGSFGAMPTFWTIPPSFLAGSAAAGGIALISTLGALGGFVSPTVIGAIVSSTGSLAWGQIYLAALLVLSAIVLIVLVPREEK